MNRKVFLALLSLGLIFPQAGCYAMEQKKQVEEPAESAYIYDFGKVKEGQILKHDFVLKNESKKILKIRQVSTSCGCTASQAQKKELLPGESTKIEVKFHTKGYSGPTKQYVYVHTDNFDNPVIQFTITADVIKGGK
jgi:hypothetical protein